MSGSVERPTRILLIGGCGFIGTNLIGLLNRNGGAEITVLDNESVGRREYLDGLDVARFIHGDVRDAVLVAEAMAGQDAVVLLAAQTNVMKSIADPMEDCDQNIRGGLTALQAAAAAKVGRFVFCSSSAPVGMQPPPMREDLAARPASPYGASKLAVEGYCSAFYHSYGLKTVALRFSNCYGPGSDNKSSVVAHFMKEVLAGRTLTVFGDGEQTRDYIHVADLCQAINLAITGGGEGADIFGQPYQVATGTETTLNVLIGKLRALAEADDYPLRVEYKPARAGEIVRNYSDISRFCGCFGFQPSVKLDDGLQETWRYFLNGPRQR